MTCSSVWPSPPAAKNENMVCSSRWPSLSVAKNMLKPAEKRRVYTNLADLPLDLTSDILLRLGAIQILEKAQKVCRSWRDVCKDPSMWRKIDMHNLGKPKKHRYDLKIMCRHAVDRSEGGLTEIALWYFATDSLLNYIADRSSNLRSLRLVRCSYPVTYKGFVEAVVKLPLLEDLELSYCLLSHESLRVVGQSCPNMKSLILNCDGYNEWAGWGIYPEDCDDEALAIAETMPRLRHIQLIGNSLSDTGLNAILDKCPNLEYLDLRRCFCIKLEKCFERIKVVRRPNDSLNGYPFNANIRNRDYYEYNRYSDSDSDGDTDTDRPRYCDYLSDYDYCEYDQYDEPYDFILD